MKKILILVGFLMLLPSFAKAQSCNLNATTSNFSSQLSAAAPGQTLCLATGNYGTFNGVQKSSPGVTITAASGATPTMSISFLNSPGAAWLTLDHLTITGGTISGPTNNVTFQNNTWTDKLAIYATAKNNVCSGCAAMNNSNILFNGEMFNMAANQSGTGGYEGRVQFILGGPTPAGLTIENSKFTTGCADGIQGGGAGWGYGVTIGPGNQFYNLIQGNCGPHVDSIQFNGSENGPNSATGPRIIGNYFYNDSTGIVSYDYDSDAYIADNVVTNIGNSIGIGLAGFDSSTVVEHNTVVGDEIDCDVTHEGNVCKASIVNNITTSIHLTTSGGTGNPSLSDYNLCTSGGCPGSHSLSGTPTYVGGKSSTTYAGFALTSASVGHNAGTDGQDLGINVSDAISSAPAPPTGLSVSVQ